MIVLSVDKTTVLAMHLTFYSSLFPRYRSASKTVVLATQLMPCYGCELKHFSARFPISLSNTNHASCHGKTPRNATFLTILLCLALLAALPQLSRATDTPAQDTNPTASAPQSQQTIERPDFSVHVPRPNAPTSKLNVPFVADDTSKDENGVYHLRGKVVFELPDATFKADAVDFDSNSGVVNATGNVYYRNYDHDEVMYSDTAEYNTNTEYGT